MNLSTHLTGSIPVIPVGEAGPSTTTDHNHGNQNTMERVAIDETLPSQSIEVMTEPIPVHHKKPVDCPHKDSGKLGQESEVNDSKERDAVKTCERVGVLSIPECDVVQIDPQTLSIADLLQNSPVPNSSKETLLVKESSNGDQDENLLAVAREITPKNIQREDMKDILQIKEVHRRLEEENVDVRLLEDLLVMDFDSSTNRYSLPTRISYNKLVQEFAADVKAAELVFKTKISLAKEFFMANMMDCKKMDMVLGEPDEERSVLPNNANDSIMRQKDGTKRVTCLIKSCGVQTYRLRRHMKTMHPGITQRDVDYIVKMSIAITSNSDITVDKSDLSDKVEHKNKGDGKTNLVSRRHNWKLCVLCKTLQSNMTTHLKVTHKIEKDRNISAYNSYIKDSEVVPKCYLKKCNGRMILLEGDELETAKKEKGDVVAEQQTTVESLRILREEREQAFVKKNAAKNDLEREIFDHQWRAADVKYKTVRYQDTRPYSEKMISWKNSFLKHLEDRQYANPRRLCNTTFDILLSYEEKTGSKLDSKDLFDARKIREILTNFKGVSNITATSKLKYLSTFNVFIKFIFLDVDSPESHEKMSCDEMVSRNFRLKQTQQEITTFSNVLSKSKGADLIITKEKAKGKLVKREEMDDLLGKLTEDLSEIYRRVITLEIQIVTLEEKMRVRDCLIAVATIRLSRRSKEIICLKLDEVDKAEIKKVDETNYHMISVHEHKNTKKGVPATIAYTENEFKILKYYIAHIRESLLNDVSTPYVFTHEITSSRSKPELSYVSLFNILRRFKTQSGKSISSRSIRSSTVTDSMKKLTTEAGLRDLASSMGHTREVQLKHYNYEETCEASLRVLCDRSSQSYKESQPSTSAGINHQTCAMNRPCIAESSDITLSDIFSDFESLANEASSSTVHDQSTEISLSQEKLRTSTPNKRNRDGSPPHENDETLLNLRNKKIKQTMNTKELTEALKFAMESVNGSKELFITCKGNITIKPIKHLLSSELLSNFPSKEIKKSLSKLLI